MSIAKEAYIKMKWSQIYTWDLFFEYWEDHGGHDVSFEDFSGVWSEVWPQINVFQARTLISMLVEYFDAKFNVTKIISPNGELLNEY